MSNLGSPQFKILGAALIISAAALFLISETSIDFETQSLPPKKAQNHQADSSPKRPSPFLIPLLDEKHPPWIRDIGTYEISLRTKTPESVKDVLRKFSPGVRKNSSLHLEVEVIDNQRKSFYKGQSETLVTTNYLFTNLKTKDRVYEFSSQIAVKDENK